MEEARIAFLAEIGWDYARLEEMGVISPVIGIDCRYLTASTFSDVIEIIVSVEELKGVRLPFSMLDKASIDDEQWCPKCGGAAPGI